MFLGCDGITYQLFLKKWFGNTETVPENNQVVEKLFQENNKEEIKSEVSQEEIKPQMVNTEQLARLIENAQNALEGTSTQDEFDNF